MSSGVFWNAHGYGISSGGGGGTVSTYVASVNVADWIPDGNDSYTFTISSNEHNKGTSPVIQVFQTVNSTLDSVQCEISVDSTGSVEVRVQADPDGRFDGRIFII